jgi:AraC-like DNA-binding protein
MISVMAGRVPKAPITLSVSVLTQMVRYLEHLRIDTASVFRAAGVEPDLLERPDARMAVEAYMALEEEAARASGDPCFGLHMGGFHDAGHWSALGYMMMNCRTLGEAFEKGRRYSAIIGNLISGTAHIGLRKVRLIFHAHPQAPAPSRHCVECVISSSVSLARRLAGRRLSPLAVGLAYPPPVSPDEYRRMLGCLVLFDQKHTHVDWDLRLADLPVVAPNPALLERFEAYAKECLADLEVNETTRAVTKHVLAGLDSRRLSIRSVARDLHVSVRTLQGRLEAEGITFSELLEHLRERMAKRELRANTTVEDIAYMLGYAEASAFRKAFKRWTDLTPAEYRKSVRAAPGISVMEQGGPRQPA